MGKRYIPNEVINLRMFFICENEIKKNIIFIQIRQLKWWPFCSDSRVLKIANLFVMLPYLVKFCVKTAYGRIVLDNGFALVQRQAIIWTNEAIIWTYVDILLSEDLIPKTPISIGKNVSFSIQSVETWAPP